MASSSPPSLRHTLSRAAERFAYRVTAWVGSVWAFALAVLTILIWAGMGPFVNPPYNDTWQLVINTGTTIITFLMVFLIQRSQNKDTLTLQIKLNEIIAALKGASNRLINVEDLTEDEVRELHERYKRLAELAANDLKPGKSHSIEEAVRANARRRPRPSSKPPRPCKATAHPGTNYPSAN